MLMMPLLQLQSASRGHAFCAKPTSIRGAVAFRYPSHGCESTDGCEAKVGKTLEQVLRYCSVSAVGAIGTRMPEYVTKFISVREVY
eukprot:346329-Rhodomonas_salina.1